MIVARSFARIHGMYSFQSHKIIYLLETNLKKQGVFPATFINSEDYNRIPENAFIDTVGLLNLAPGSKIGIKVKDGNNEIVIELVHTMSEDQIEWFKAGSSLNMISRTK